MIPLRIQSFDRDDLPVGYIGDRYGAGADGDAVKMYGAGATEPLAAAELGAGQSELIADESSGTSVSPS